MAKLAGLPDEVTERAKQVLKTLDAASQSNKRVTQLDFEDFDCLIHAIKTKHSLVRRGVAEARDITRIYGKIRKKRYDVLDFDDDDEFDESDYILDDDDDYDE